MSIQKRSRRTVWIGASALVLSCLSLTPTRAQAPVQTPAPGGPVATPVRTFVEGNCQTCHNSAFPSGSIDLQQMVNSADSLTNQRDAWDAVASALRSGFMPPPEAPKPSPAAVTAFLAALGTELANAKPSTQPAPPPPAPPTKDWLTFSYDGERTGWQRSETKLNKDNVSSLNLLWRLQTDHKPSTINRYSSMTDPLVVHGVQTPQGVKSLVYVASADNDVYAIDADKGVIVWKKSFPYTVPPPQAASNNCPNNLNATPYVDKANGIIYVLPNDGKLRGLALGDGAEKFPATRILPHYTRNFSLNVINGTLFTGATRGCGGATSEIVSVDLVSPEHPVYHFYTSGGKGSGPWGRGGIVKYPYGALAQTADGPVRAAGRPLGRLGARVQRQDGDGGFLHADRRATAQPEGFRPRLQQPARVSVRQPDARGDVGQRGSDLPAGCTAPGRRGPPHSALHLTAILERRV